MNYTFTNKLVRVSYVQFMQKLNTAFQSKNSWIYSRTLLFVVFLAFSLHTQVHAQKTACKVDCGELIGGTRDNISTSWADVKFFTKNIFLPASQYESDALSSYVPGTSNITFNKETANGRGDYGIGIVGPNTNPAPIAAQINYIAEKKRSEKLLVDFGCTFTGADVKLARFFSDENGGMGETGGWRAFDANFNLVGIGTFAANVPFSANNPGLFSLRIRAGAPFRYLEFTARAYANRNQKTAFDDNSDYYLQSIVPSCLPILEPETALGNGETFDSWQQASLLFKPLDNELFFAADETNFSADGLGVPNDENMQLNYCTDDNSTELIQIDLGSTFTSFELVVNDLFEGEEGFWIAYNYNSNFELVEVGSGSFTGQGTPTKAAISGQTTTSATTSDTGGFRVISVGGGPLGGGKRTRTQKTSCGVPGFFIRQFTPAPVCLGAVEVTSYNPGKNKLGGKVLSDRQVLSNALFAPEDNDTPGDINFVSLGFGGEITVKFLEPFANGEGNDVMVFETSYEENGDCESHPEKADVFASQDGINFVYLGLACRDQATFDLGPLSWAQYIRIVDISKPQNFTQNNAAVDGYDVDGVICLNGRAETTPNDGLVACTAQDVVEYRPGKRKDGKNIGSERTKGQNALGEPDGNDSVLKFASLGFGDGRQKGEKASTGFITLRFDFVIFDKPGKDIKIFETSYGNPNFGQFPEEAKVYVSRDGNSWVYLGTTNTNCSSKLDSELDFAGKITWAQFVRIVDATDKNAKMKNANCQNTNQNAFNGAADGFDVDAVTCAGYEGAKFLEETPYYQFEQELSGYPNPVSDRLKIDLSLEEFVAPDVNVFKVKVLDFMGTEVGDFEAELDNEFQLDVNLQGLEPGIYILQFNSQGIVRTLKVIKK